MDQNPMPASWNIGSFHPNNRQYTAQQQPMQQAKPPLPGMGLPPRHATSRSGLPGKSPGVFPEDHFRCIKENKQIMSNYQKTFKKRTDMAMSRFDSDQNLAAQMPGGAANALVDENPGLGPLAKRLMMDPDITQAEALALIVLPPETIYLIDKVVRQKARCGPIGIDCSEVINIEMENEFKARNKHIYKLNNGELDDEAAEELADGYIDAQGVYHGMDQDKRLFQQNEKLLQRLTKAAVKENEDLLQQDPPGRSIDQTAATDIINISGNHGASTVDASALVRDHVQQQSYDAVSRGPNGQSKTSIGSKSAVQPSSLAGQPSHATKVLELQADSVKVSHGEWVRRKNHETKLKGKLILEAKRDLLETLIQKQEEEAIRMQGRSHQMLEWDSRKKMHIQHKKLVKLQRDEKERLEKKQKQDISFLKFKDWLKTSLIKQREDQMGKKIDKHNKKVTDEEEKRRKKHREVLAKIAYKDWKQTKGEEEKLRQKREQIERRQGLFDSKSFTRQKPTRTKMTRHSSARGFAPSQNSSRYINTDQKRNQIETRGGQANILAYSLNKNMKKTRPKTAGKARAAPKPKRQTSYNRAQQQPGQQQNQYQQPDTYNGYFYGQQPQYGQNQAAQQQNYVQQDQQQEDQQQYAQQLAQEQEQQRQDIYFQNQQHLQEPINEQEEDESTGQNQMEDMQQQQLEYEQEDDEYGDQQQEDIHQQQQLQDQIESQEAQQLLQNQHHQLMQDEEDQMDEDEDHDQMQQMVQEMDDMEGEDMIEGEEEYDQNELQEAQQFQQQQQMLDMEGFEEDEDNEQQEYDGEMMEEDDQEQYDEEYIRQVQQMQALQQQQQMMMQGQMEDEDEVEGEEYAQEDDEDENQMYQQQQQQQQQRQQQQQHQM